MDEIKFRLIFLSPKNSISLNENLFEFLFEYSGWYPQLDNKKMKIIDPSKVLVIGDSLWHDVQVKAETTTVCSYKLFNDDS